MIKILKILMFPFYFLSKTIPKTNDIIVIGSSKGKHFSDNSKYLFLYFSHNINNKKIIWISKNKKVVSRLKKNGYGSEYYLSIKGLYYTIRAKNIVISHHLEDVNRYLIGGSKVVQLWHGNPIRKIGYDGDWNDYDIFGKIKKMLYTKVPFLYYMMCDVLIVTSIEMKHFFKIPFKYSFRNNINMQVLGYPRLDALDDKYKFNKIFFPEIDNLVNLKEKYKFVISWLPTHRSILNKTFFDLINENDIDFININCKLQTMESILVIKPHFLEIDALKNKFSELSNIIVYKETDPYPLLNHTDILITDYSSVFIDFLIKDKPIIFLPIDYEEYCKKVNFYYDYREFVPGPICNDWNEIIDNIETILNKRIDDFQDKRVKMKKKFFHFEKDNCKRLAEYLKEL